MNIHFEAKDIFMKVLSPTPAPSPAKPSALPESTSPMQPCPT